MTDQLFEAVEQAVSDILTTASLKGYAVFNAAKITKAALAVARPAILEYVARRADGNLSGGITAKEIRGMK